MLVGDAFGFLDPVYSSGIFLALESGEMAADAIVDGLREGDLSGERLGRFLTEYLQGMETIRKLVYAFYSEDFSFGEFLKANPECQQHIVRDTCTPKPCDVDSLRCSLESLPSVCFERSTAREALTYFWNCQTLGVSPAEPGAYQGLVSRWRD